MSKKSSVKGAKKGRRFGRPRSDAAKARCAKRKEARKSLALARQIANNARRDLGTPTPWESAKAKRSAARH